MMTMMPFLLGDTLASMGALSYRGTPVSADGE